MVTASSSPAAPGTLDGADTPGAAAGSPSDCARDSTVIAATRDWLTRAVIGLNLCPFAKAVHVKQQIRYYVSQARDLETVLEDLERELRGLAECDPQHTDTTLLIMPHALAQFSDYNDALYFAERLLKSLRLAGTLQIASFHPQYRFADSAPDAVENYTNRAPYPIFHLLREASVARAVAAFPEAEQIYERNQQTLRELGLAGWQACLAGSPR
jgi:hypothetical protein